MKNGKLLLLSLLSTGLLLSACGIQGATSTQGDSSILEPASGDVSSQDQSSEDTASLEVSSEDALSEVVEESSEGQVLSVVGKTFVGHDIVQKDYSYYDAMKELVEAMTFTFKEDNTFWMYSGKAQSGAMVIDRETFYFGTYVIGKETIDATPDYGIFGGRRSDIPEQSKEANKMVLYWDANGNLLLKIKNMDSNNQFVDLDIVMKEGEVIKEYEAPEEFATYHFADAFAEAVSGELPSAAEDKVANAKASYADSTYGISNKGNAYVEINVMGHTAKFTGTYTNGENAGEYVIDWDKYYVDDELLKDDVTNPIFTIVPMQEGYKIPVSENTDSDTGAQYIVYAYYAIEAE